MFYSQVILARKGPLGKIWLAAHFDKKLTKNQIFSTDITDSVDAVIHSSNPLALRVSGHLMLGIVRIYGRKVRYLMSDCTEAMWKIKLAFRTGNVNLTEAQLNTINQIDDNRYFGNIDPDIDFPELEDTAFLHTNDVKMRASRLKSIGSRSDTIQDYDIDYSHDISFPSPAQTNYQDYISLPSASGYQSIDKTTTKKGGDSVPSSQDTSISKASSIEIARNIRHQSTQGSRLSYSGVGGMGGGGVGGTISMNFQDDIPPFEDMYHPRSSMISSQQQDIMIPPMDDDYMMMYGAGGDVGDIGGGGMMMMPLQSPITSFELPPLAPLTPIQPDIHTDRLTSISSNNSRKMNDSPNSLTDTEKEEEEDQEDRETRIIEKKKVVKQPKMKPKQVRYKKNKKQKIQVDERVEISNKEYKEMLDNVTSIVRKKTPLESPTPTTTASPLLPQSTTVSAGGGGSGRRLSTIEAIYDNNTIASAAAIVENRRRSSISNSNNSNRQSSSIPVPAAHNISMMNDDLCVELQDVYNMAISRHSLVTLKNPDPDPATSEEDEDEESAESEENSTIHSEEISEIEKARNINKKGDTSLSTIQDSVIKSSTKRLSTVTLPNTTADLNLPEYTDHMGDVPGTTPIGEDYATMEIPPFMDEPMMMMDSEYPSEVLMDEAHPLASTMSEMMIPSMDKYHRLSALLLESATSSPHSSTTATAGAIPDDTLSSHESSSISGMHQEKWNPRTKIVYDIIHREFQNKSEVSFQELSKDATRRAVATCFMELLQLKTWNIIDMTQLSASIDTSHSSSSSYNISSSRPDIMITPTESTYAVM